MTPSPRIGRRALMIVALLALIGTGTVASTANASNFGAYGGVFFANGNNHYFYYSEASDFTISDTRWVRDVDFEPTDLTTAYTAHDSSDVAVADTASGNSYGYYICESVSLSYGDRCNHAHVRIYANFNPDHTTRRATLCQEIGHSVGLQHDSSNGCMHGAVNSPYLTSHDVGHINGRY